MPKPPVVTADQLGAVIDGVASTNAMMFMLLASPEQTDAALRLLDRLAQIPTDDEPLNFFRGTVAEATALAIRGWQEASGERDQLGRSSTQ